MRSSGHSVPAGGNEIPVQWGVPSVVQLIVPVPTQSMDVPPDVQLLPCAHALQTPSALQYIPAPQLDPAGASPPGTHTGAPVPHAMVPVRQVPGEHAIPVTHGTQLPVPLHTPPAQGVPATAFPTVTHTAAPDVQLIAPVVQEFPVLQLAPVVHEMQLPVPVHTPPGQAVPGGTLPTVVHTGAPDEQLIAPVVQGLPVLQPAPATHGTHVPVPLHTPPGQVVPAATLPVVPHTGAPVVQLIAPVVHAFPVLHAMPAVHVTHVPVPLHTPPVHGVPAGELPVAPHTGAPLVHVSVPVRQAGMPVAHAMPGTHGTHAPAPLHTPPVHTVPAGTLPLVVHTGPPEAQMVVPVVQALPVLHAAPVTHGTHVPVPLHTPPGHAEPTGALPLAVHTGAPLAQLMVPVVQALPVLHDAPDAHVTHMPLPSHMPPAQSVPAGELPVVLHTGAPVVQAMVPV